MAGILASKALQRKGSSATARAAAAGSLLLAIAYAMALFQRTAFGALGPRLVAEFGLDAVSLGDLGAIFFWAYLVVIVPAGLLVDAIGPRRLVVRGTAAAALGCLVFALGDSFAALMAGRALIAVGSGVAFVSMMRFIAEWYPEGRATQAGRGILLGNLGAIASGAPLDMVLEGIGWRPLWAGFGFAFAAMAWSAWRIVPESRTARSRLAWREAGCALGCVLATRWTWLGIVLLGGVAGSFFAFANLASATRLVAEGHAPATAAWQISVLLGSYGIGASVWGWIGDRTHARTGALFLATACSVSLWIVLAYTRQQSLMATGLLHFAVGFAAGTSPLVFTLVSERFPRERMGLSVAVMNCGLPLGAAVLQSLSARLDSGAAVLPMLAASLLALLAAALAWSDRRGAVRLRPANGEP